MHKLKQINWESGMSESISFLLLFPFVLTCMYIMFYAMQTSYVRQSLQYTTYCATRAAVVYDNYDDGVAKAREVVDKALPYGRMGITWTQYTLTGVGSNGERWSKGVLKEGTLQAQIKSVLPYQGMRYRTVNASIIMMVERPVS